VGGSDAQLASLSVSADTIACGDMLVHCVQKATEAESEAYEAHAVLLSMKRKQQDSAGSVLKIARAMKQPRLRDAAKDMQKKSKQGADALAKTLSDFSVVIATKDSQPSWAS
jgi:transcriptional regulator GlxA family with amidase domain